MLRHSFSTVLGRFCLLLVLAAMLAGCGGASDEPVGYHLSGKVTFGGNPIPQGKIYFNPDTAQGNEGVAGYADIVDGAYDTSLAGGKRHPSGKIVVRIEGFDPAGQSTDDSSGEQIVKPLFPTYETQIELPAEDSTKDFAVPPSSAEEKKQPDGNV